MPASNVMTSAGSTIALTATAPATFDASGYGALTYTTIGEVTDLGEFGKVYAVVTHNPLASRNTVKRKGSYNNGSVAIQLALDEDDAGQTLAETALDSDDSYTFEVTLQNGAVYYFTAQVTSFPIQVGSVDQITTATLNVEIDSDDIVKVAAPAS